MIDPDNLAFDALSSGERPERNFCGFAEIDDWWYKNAQNDHASYKTRVFVAKHEAETIAIFTLAIAAPTIARPRHVDGLKVPRNGALKCVELAYVAVRKKYQKGENVLGGRSVGPLVLARALGQIANIGRAVGVEAVFLTAGSAPLINFYTEVGFVGCCQRDPHRLFMPMKKVVDAFWTGTNRF